MKKVAFLLAVMCMVCAGIQPVSAQENGNRDENNKIVRGPYLTNEADGNWWINLAGGITAFGDGGCHPRVTPALDFNFGKWFTPSIGVRAGYQGLTGSMWSPRKTSFAPELDSEKNLYKSKFGYAYAHGDFMWNISNAFSGYKETRFWNVIPYLHGGLLCTYKSGAVDKEFAAGAGIYNTMRLCDRAALTLDLRGILTNGRQLQNIGGVAGEISLTFGVAVNLGKTNWTRKPAKEVDESALARISELEMSNKALAADKEQLTAANAVLKDQNAALEEKAVNAVEEAKVAAKEEVLESIVPHSFYFGIGKTVLTQTEISHLDFYISNIRDRINEDMVIHLTVRADAKTGSKERNEYLNNTRVNYIQKLLKERYGFEKAKFETEYKIVESEHPALDRAIQIRFK